MSKQALDMVAAELAAAIRKAEDYGTSEQYRKNTLNRVPHRLVANPDYVFDISELLGKDFINDTRLKGVFDRYGTASGNSSEIIARVQGLLRDAFRQQVKSSKRTIIPERGGPGYLEFPSYSAAQTFINSVIERITKIGTDPKYSDAYQRLASFLGTTTYTYTTREGIEKTKERLNIDAGHLFSAASIGYRNIDLQRVVDSSREGLNAQIDERIRSATSAEQKAKAKEDKKKIKFMLDKFAQAKNQRKFKTIIDQVNREIDLNLKVEKSITKGNLEQVLTAQIAYLFMQPSIANQILGSALRQGGSLRKWIDSIAEDYMDLKSSKTIKEMVDATVESALKGKDYKYKSTTTTSKRLSIPSKAVRIDKVKLPSLDAKKYLIQTAIIKGQQVQKLKQGGKFASLQKLVLLVNSELEDRIKSNMGKGKSKTILNYRSGRFAKSVRLLNLSATRQDAVNVAYTYMKYPYQTFEPGFRQGVPSSRDPRILIQKSIRQIISEKFAQELSYKFTRI